jgi:thiol-disulfide isomerase/thioredoxin
MQLDPEDYIRRNDQFKLQTLGYSYPSRTQDSCITAALVGAAVVFVYMTLTRPSSPMYHPVAHQYGTRATQYATRATAMLGRAVSARVGGATDVIMSLVSDGTFDAREVYSQLPKGAVSLVDCSKRTENGWKEMTEGDKATCLATAKSLVQKKDKIAIMLFAPWCPHCHAAMQGFAEMSAKHPGVPFVMINAEALPRDAFTGSDPFYPLEYFPTFAVKTAAGGKLEGVESVAGIADKLPAAAPAAVAAARATAKATSARRAAAPPPTPSGPVQPDPFANLF